MIIEKNNTRKDCGGKPIGKRGWRERGDDGREGKGREGREERGRRRGKMMYIVGKQRMEDSLERRENLYNFFDDLHTLKIYINQ